MLSVPYKYDFMQRCCFFIKQAHILCVRGLTFEKACKRSIIRDNVRSKNKLLINLQTGGLGEPSRQTTHSYTKIRSVLRFNNNIQ